jgi:hypothetical protein
MDQRLVTSKKLSQIINLPTYSIRKLAREGKIPSYRIDGKNLLFDPDEVILHIKNRLKKTINDDPMSLTVTDTHKEVI